MLYTQIEFLVHFLNFDDFAKTIQACSYKHQSIFVIGKSDYLGYVHIVNARTLFFAQHLKFLGLPVRLG